MAHKKGEETRIITSVRIEPHLLAKIREVYGTLADFLYKKASRDKKLRK